MDRRSVVLGLGASAAAASLARAAWTPSRPVTVVVPYPAGGGTDVLARILGREGGTALGASVVIENMPGASGAVGSRRVARADPDGQTLIVTTNQTHATNISLLRDGGGYDPVGDFTVLGGLADLQHLLVVRKELAAGSVADVVAAAAKAGGAKLTCASTGIGSASHLTMELFKTRTRTDFVHVPYRGAAPLLQDMVGGRVDLAFATVPTVLGQVQAGEVRALAVASPRRSPQVPDVPTLVEAGIAGVEADAWIAAFGPAKLPPEIRDRYAAVFRDVLAKPDLAALVTGQGMLPNWREPDAFAAFQKDDIARWAALIRTANVPIE